jgi:hypothetical protein
LEPAPRAGATLVYILPKVPRQGSAKWGAQRYGKRWTVETACQHGAAYVHAARNPFSYPNAALFGFCLALVA